MKDTAAADRRQNNLRAAARRAAENAIAAPEQAPSTARTTPASTLRRDAHVGVSQPHRGAVPHAYGSPGGPTVAGGATISAGGRPLNGNVNVAQNPTHSHADGVGVTVRQGSLVGMQPDLHGTVPLTSRSQAFSPQRGASSPQALGNPIPATPRTQQAPAGAAIRVSGAPNQRGATATGTPAATGGFDPNARYIQPPRSAGDGAYAISVSGAPKTQPAPATAPAPSAVSPVEVVEATVVGEAMPLAAAATTPSADAGPATDSIE